MPANRIKLLRKGLNLSQAEFSEKLGVSQSKLSSYENGKMPPLDMLLRAAETFQVSLDWLMGLPVQNSQLDDERTVADLQINANILLPDPKVQDCDTVRCSLFFPCKDGTCYVSEFQGKVTWNPGTETVPEQALNNFKFISCYLQQE